MGVLVTHGISGMNSVQTFDLKTRERRLILDGHVYDYIGDESDREYHFKGHSYIHKITGPLWYRRDEEFDVIIDRSSRRHMILSDQIGFYAVTMPGCVSNVEEVKKCA